MTALTNGVISSLPRHKTFTHHSTRLVECRTSNEAKREMGVRCQLPGNYPRVVAQKIQQRCSPTLAAVHSQQQIILK